MSRTRKLLPYAGGKSCLVKRLLELMPEHKCYCEVFAGGAAIIGAKTPEASACEVLNDADGRLVNLYRVAKYHPQALQDELHLTLRSRAEYETFRQQPGVTDVQRAARYLFCLLNTFANCSHFHSFATSRTGHLRWYPASVASVIEWLDSRLERVTIECLDFAAWLGMMPRRRGSIAIRPIT